MPENNPAPSDPAPSDPASSDPAPSDPAPSDLDPPDPAIVIAPGITHRRWPWWAWALLLVGVPLLSLQLIGAALLSEVVLGQATHALTCLTDGGCDAERVTETIPTPPEDPDDAAEALNRVSLDGEAVFDGQPEWILRLDRSWQPSILDEGGLNVFWNEDTGCSLLTSQRHTGPVSTEMSEAESSSTLLQWEIGGFTGDNTEALILNRGVTDLPLQSVDSGATIEFASATVLQEGANGHAETIEIVARSMPASESELVAALTCESSAMYGFDFPFEVFSTALAVTATP